MTNAKAYSTPELLFRLLYFVFGTVVTAAGASVFILTGTGTDPFGMLMQGVAKTVGITNGVAHVAINAAFIVVILFVDRKYIRIGTFAALFATGPMIDFFSRLFSGLIHAGLPYFVRLGITAVSCFILGFGLSGVINASVGTGANDIVAVLLSDKLRVQFRWVRVGTDAAFVAAGYLLGGVIGAGTVLCVLLTGPATQFFMPITARPLLKALCRLLPE